MDTLDLGGQTRKARTDKDRLLAELTQHVGTGVLSDDVTMVLVRTG
jgi:hypothetical protein